MSHGGKEELTRYYHLRTNIKRLKKERRGETGAKGKIKIKELNTKYRLKKKGINLVIEELKEGLIAKKTKIKRYEQTMSQFGQIQTKSTIASQPKEGVQKTEHRKTR